MNQRPHDTWASWTTPEIRRYLKKYTAPIVPGKCSSHRRKKIRYLQTLLCKREQAERLILNSL